jgi:hypothetical protein
VLYNTGKINEKSATRLNLDGKGTFIWTTSPAVAEVVVKQLGRARLKRPESMHLIVVM